MSPRQQLTDRARRAVAQVSRPVADWVPRSAAEHDVVIIGGGQSGISIAFALRRAGIGHFAVYDEVPSGVSNWNSTARMRTLRTPKTITGLEQGIPELSFETYYEGLNGPGSFETIGKIKTADWSDYFDWFKEVVDVPVAYDTRLVGVEPDRAGLLLTLEHAGRRFTTTARKLILATGMGGLGKVIIPEALAELPRHLWSHTHDNIDFAALQGKRIGVLGAASSAFDTAATALERGAASVDLFCRHPELAVQRVDSKLTLITELYVTKHFIDLPEDVRWRLISKGRARGVVPEESIARAEAFPSFETHLASSWDAISAVGDKVVIRSSAASHEFDHVITATGYDVDIHARPELAKLAPHIASWGDRYTPPAGEEDAAKAAYPFVGPGFEFTERHPGKQSWVRQVHVFNYAAILNHGYHVGDISSTRDCVARLVDAVARDFFTADVSAQLAPFTNRQETVPIDTKSSRVA